MSPDERLAAAVRALRETPEASVAEIAEAQRRVMASVAAERVSPHRRRPGFAAAAAAVALLGSTVWAARAGLIDVPPWLGAVLRRPPAAHPVEASARPAGPAVPSAVEPAGSAPPAPPATPTTTPLEIEQAEAAPQGPVSVHSPGLAPSPSPIAPVVAERRRSAAPTVPSAESPPVAASSSPAPFPVERAPTVEPPGRSADELYARGHRAHFVDRDPLAALAIWDTYLAAAPEGRFAPEARFNRAIDLVRLGRTDEAVSALEALTQGTYRASDAARLLDAVRRGAIRSQP